jgi:hypothetical protein
MYFFSGSNGWFALARRVSERAPFFGRRAERPEAVMADDGGGIGRVPFGTSRSTA